MATRPTKTSAKKSPTSISRPEIGLFANTTWSRFTHLKEFCIIYIYFDVTTWEMPLRQASTPCRIGRRTFGLFAIIFRNRWHSPHRSPIWCLSFSDDMFSSITHIFWSWEGIWLPWQCSGFNLWGFLILDWPGAFFAHLFHQPWRKARRCLGGKCLKTYGALHVQSLGGRGQETDEKDQRKKMTEDPLPSPGLTPALENLPQRITEPWSLKDNTERVSFKILGQGGFWSSSCTIPAIMRLQSFSQ